VAAREAIDDGDVGAAWVIPEGFTSAVRSAGESEILVIGDVDSPQTTSVVRAIAGRYATGIGTATLAGLIAVQTGVAGPDEVGAVAEGVASAPPLAELVDVAAESSLLDTTTNVMAGMALFFTFFIAGLPSVSLLEERSTGTLSRLLVAPVPSAAITAGKLLGAVLLGTLSMCALMAASSVLMGADWGPPLGALLVAAAAVIAAVGIMSVGGSLARSTEQAGNAQSIVAIVLAILGGAFVPIPGGDAGALGILKGLTPHGWWFDGVAALQHDGLSSALPAVAVLVTMGVATGALGLWLSRQVLRR
jgi:ABC-2 type transport system permease protein